MSGKLFDNEVEKIPSGIAPYIQQAIIAELLDIYPSLEILPIGSVGKKPIDDYNGDIDIAIKCKDIKELEIIINNTFDYLEAITIESLYIVSIKYPWKIEDNPIKFVQCDFMIMWDKDYTAFRYYCPDYSKNESNYKVGAKIMFANMIINHTKERHDNLEKDYQAKFDFRPTALYRFVYDIKNNRYKEEFITTDVNTIVNMCFNDGDRNHFNSIETLWEGIHSDTFKYPEEVKAIEKNFFINCWRKGWTSIKPEQFKLQYWTNEEIWKYINIQKNINKINQIADGGREI